MKIKGKKIYLMVILLLGIVSFWLANWFCLDILHGADEYSMLQYTMPDISSVRIGRLGHIFAEGEATGSVKRLYTLNAILCDPETNQAIDADTIDFVLMNEENRELQYGIAELTPELNINFSAYAIPDGKYRLCVITDTDEGGSCVFITDDFFNVKEGSAYRDKKEGSIVDSIPEGKTDDAILTSVAAGGDWIYSVVCTMGESSIDQKVYFKIVTPEDEVLSFEAAQTMRVDIAKLYHNPDFLFSGAQIRLNPEEYPVGEYKLSIYVEIDGQMRKSTKEVEFSNNGEAFLIAG